MSNFISKRKVKNICLYGILLFSFFNQQSALSCVTAIKGASGKESWKSYWNAHKKLRFSSQRKPSQNMEFPYSKQDPWGGSDASKWRPEAILANAVSEALNDGWSQSNVKDVLVALPVKMQFSNLRTYGDGQTNASLSFGTNWNFTQPPVIAILLLKKTGEMKLRLRLHRSFDLSKRGLQLSYSVNGQKKNKHFEEFTRSSEGDFEVVWEPSPSETPEWGNLFQNNVAFIQPDGWKDWFPIDFRDVVRPASELLAQIPIAKRQLGKGTLLDPENVSVQGKEDKSAFPFLGMQNENFGKDINADRYFPVPGLGIHNEFIQDSKSVITAVGHGNTLVMIKQPSPFKLAYICFDARNTEEEAKYGVPSGSGWHEIGDPAETVINSLENAPVIFGYTNGKPASNTPSSDFAYGLTDVAVIRKLQPGSAIISAAGDTTTAEDNSGWQNRGTKQISSGRNYHWFIFHHPHEVCAIEWVHPKVPMQSNHLGFDSL
jgi:hypothetical protein